MTKNIWDAPSLSDDGEIYMGSSGNPPQKGFITGDSNIGIVNGANSITVNNNAAVGRLKKIASATASDSASITFTDLSSSYFLYILRFNDLLPATDATTLLFRTSSNNGVSYDAGASDYAWSYNLISETGSESGSLDTSDSSITLIGVAGSSDEMGSGTNERASGTVWIYNPMAVKYTLMNSECQYFNEAGQNIQAYCGGNRISAGSVNAVQLLMDVGNIASATCTLYGVLNA